METPQTIDFVRKINGEILLTMSNGVEIPSYTLRDIANRAFNENVILISGDTPKWKKVFPPNGEKPFYLPIEPTRCAFCKATSYDPPGDDWTPCYMVPVEDWDHDSEIHNAVCPTCITNPSLFTFEEEIEMYVLNPNREDDSSHNLSWCD